MTGLMHPQARLVDAASGEVFTRRDLPELPGEGLVLVLAPQTVAAALAYLSAFESGRPVIVLDPGFPVCDFVRRYAPGTVVGCDVPLDGYRPVGGAQVRVDRDVPPTHPDLGLLLATSGSTGNPKLVRLARRSVLANATAITQALGISGDDVAPTSLPLFYTFGLSVLNSHMIAGGTIVVAAQGLLSRDFWHALDAYRCTSLAAVPAQFDMLRRLRFDRQRHPSLAKMITAGGRLRPELALEFADRMADALYLMYGQTEATARQTVLPPDRLRDKPGSVGLPVPGSSVAIDDGQVVFSGPSVMMGYAEQAADLVRGDELGGVLATGDLGRLDEEGYLYLTGRVRRIAKIFGVRLNLDDVETMLSGLGAVAAVSSGERVVVWTEAADVTALHDAKISLAGRLKLHHSGFEVRCLDNLPLLGNGKVDYRTLESLAE